MGSLLLNKETLPSDRILSQYYSL